MVTPQRDMFATCSAAAIELPGMTPDAERYFRDLYDHLIRISDLVDSYRDLTSGALDTHLSTVSNRLNVVMKQLTIIATIFLPMSFLTGFFGQNFGWMVNRITSLPVFLVVGIGLAATHRRRTARHVPPPRLAVIRRDGATRHARGHDPGWHATERWYLLLVSKRSQALQVP